MKFIDSFTDKDSRMSHVFMQHRGYVYEGISRCNPDDEWSEFTGCKFAELRAILKALEDEYKEEKVKVDAISQFVTAIEQYKNFNNEDASAKAMYRQYNRRVKRLEELKSDITDVKAVIKARLKSLETLEKKKSKES